MANVAVLGAQWGDEGKAKIIDLLAESADVIVRCQGGCNAGHTVQMNGEVFKFHHLPSGLLYENKQCIIGSGTVINPEVLRKEIADIEGRGYSTKTLSVSDRAHISLPFHIQWDQLQESRLAGKKIGTTGRGIGPTYMDKVGRLGIRVADLFDTPGKLRERLTQIVQMKATMFKAAFGETFPSLDSLMATCQEYAELFKPYVTDSVYDLSEAVQRGDSILFEGAQGTLLDIDFGTYPFVTSSNATAGGVCTGSGVGPTRLDTVIGVMKAYVTRVGEGPFPTELHDEMGKHLAEVGQEFGTTTGRQRRCGWFDAVIGRYSVIVNGLDAIALTKLDIFDGLKNIQICVAYEDTRTGERVDRFPSRVSELEHLKPIYETMAGWSGSVAEARHYDDLPMEARQYLARLAELMGVPIDIISVGPDRSQTIILNHPLIPTVNGSTSDPAPSLC